ncbi:peptidase 1 [Ceratobasidium sp. AG-I]|nr:peptidase 1 [Ceratobasidium sp. AG-I]
MPQSGRFLYCVLAFVTCTARLAGAVSVTSVSGDVKPNSYIVILHDTVSKASYVSAMKGKSSKSHLTHEYDILNAYSAELTPEALDDLTKSPDVKSIVPDTLVYPSTTLTQKDAPWGLARIASKKKLPAGSSFEKLNYHFDRRPSPAGVDVYVIDTGINIKHVDFGGRAKWGKTFGGYKDQDGNGHGTHVAGTIAGKRFGVAKAASVYAVKVLSDEGPGYSSDIIAGVDWVVAQAKKTKRPTVINMSLGGGVNEASDQAVTRAVAAGVHVIVAAGNSNEDAENHSPARAPNVITVGATSITDERWVWNPSQGSNFGKVVDIFAPGDEITSAWIGSTTAINRITGTSMATPHVAGLIAYLLAVEGRRTPANMLARVKKLAPDGILKGIPKDTRNEMIWNGAKK